MNNKNRIGKNKTTKEKKYTVILARIGSDNVELYKHEEQIRINIEKATKELMRIAGIPENEYWTKGLPSEIFSILESYDSKAMKEACLKYLQTIHNIKIKQKKGEEQ